MHSLIRKNVASLALLAVAIGGGQTLLAQGPGDDEHGNGPKLHGEHRTEPWVPGTRDEASNSTAAGGGGAQAAASGSVTWSIPASTYSFTASKDGKTYSGTIIGTSPFAATKAGSTIPVVVVPLKITIGTTAFDPMAANSCDGNISAANRFMNSPLVQSTPLTINGVSMGTTQYVNAVRRAEFWSTIGGSAGYQNTLSPVTQAAEVSVSAGSNGTLYSTGCSQLGIVSNSWISSYLSKTLIPSLTSSKVISPASFVIFLVSNVVQSSSTPPSVSNCCILGYHSSQGNPVQTYAIMDWDTTGDFGAGTADGSVSSHEIAEWMDDPLGTNATPAWGGIGQVSGCQTNWENGDPLSGTLMPAITLNGKAYHMQELGFNSWYYNKLGVASTGAGGVFSSNGTFKGPSKACPSGGTN